MTIYTKIAQSKENLLTIKKNCLQKSNFLRARISSKNCSQQKFAHRICLQHRKTAHNEEPCWLGWINTMAKCLASSQLAHGWRAPLNGLCCNGWNMLGRTVLMKYEEVCIPHTLRKYNIGYTFWQLSWRYCSLSVCSSHPAYFSVHGGMVYDDFTRSRCNI
jgi:hypothetical protein